MSTAALNLQHPQRVDHRLHVIGTLTYRRQLIADVQRRRRGRACGRPTPVVHTRHHEPRTRLVFGSCRVGDPLPTKLGPRWPDDVKAIGIDALWTYSKSFSAARWSGRTPSSSSATRTYADEVSPGTLEFIEQRRGTDVPPGEQIADFEEYTRLYRESWSEPDIRWLLSTVPTVMIFDDHDVHDDWNISWLWVEEMRAKPWWEARITGAFMAYWIYQHLGNLSPPELEDDTTFPRVKEAGDAGSLLRRLAHTWDRESAASRWAFYRDFGDTRLLVLDSRAARVLSDGRRQMIDDEEWDWIVEHSSGAFDHVLIASTLPVFLPRGIHHLAGVERGALRRALGTARREPERAAAARGRSRALGGLQSLVRAAVRLAADGHARNGGSGTAGVDSAARRRRSLQLDPRGRSRRPTRRAACTSWSARPSAIRSRRRSGASCRRPARASASSSSHDSRSWPGSRRPPRAGSRSGGDVRQRPRRARARRPHGVCDDPAEPARGRGSGAARRRSARRARRRVAGTSGPRSIPHPACARNGRKNGGPERARPRRSISPRPLRPGTLSTVCRRPRLEVRPSTRARRDPRRRARAVRTLPRRVLARARAGRLSDRVRRRR